MKTSPEHPDIRNKHADEAFSKPKARGFSLIEVTLSLGVLSFCMVGILGLIPSGLSSQKSAQEEARASSALSMVAAAVGSSQFTSRDASGNATYDLPAYLSDSAVPKTFRVGDPEWTSVFLLGEDGLIRKNNDASPARQTLFLRVIPPANEAQPVQVYAAVAWPTKQGDEGAASVNQLMNRPGFVDTFIAYAPRD